MSALRHFWLQSARGLLLEHLVLGELLVRFGRNRVHYWRDKQQHEVDFVLETTRKRDPLVIECKSSAAKFDSAGLLSFRRRYPSGANWVVTLKDTERHSRRWGDVEVTFVPFLQLPALLEGLRARR